MNNAIFISAGIGNALLAVPLIKQLKSEGTLTAISTSPFNAHEVFAAFEEPLFDQVINLQNASRRILGTLHFKKRFDRIYLDHFAATRKNILFSHVNGKQSMTNTLPSALPKIFTSRIQYIEPIPGIHEAAQYMRLHSRDFRESSLTELNFRLNTPTWKERTSDQYITIQPGSGNNQSPWKTLPIEAWVKVVEDTLIKYPDLDIVVLGDQSEIGFGNTLPNHKRIINLIGKTSIHEVPAIISGAKIHLGCDSGLMHIAGCLGVSTITVWGGSDPNCYGWHKLNNKKHIIIYDEPDCGPCNRWISPNTNRVLHPTLCPDFKCIAKIKPERITNALELTLNR